ncbi:MAG: hypothetical protein OXE78_04375 [Gammaproteobacteria bacterium]|nr:hypothetical protein [Gammaproteobacteria bacterium]
MQPAPPEALKKGLGNITFVTNDLAFQSSHHGFERPPLSGIPKRDPNRHDLTFIVDVIRI